jgi:hypothetical protein
MTFEERLQILEREHEQSKREHEERFKRIEDNLIVQGQLVARLEQRVDIWIESAETRMAKLEVLSVAVLERIDRFIAGQERNGHGN